MRKGETDELGCRPANSVHEANTVRSTGSALSARWTSRYDLDMNARMFREYEILLRASNTQPIASHLAAARRVTA
jgi:hypothetical protein